MNLGGKMNNRTWTILGLTLVVLALGVAVYVSQRGPEASVITPTAAPLPNNDGPVITQKGNSVTINTLNNDTQVFDSSTITISNNPQKGTVIINPDRTHTYAPNTTSKGEDSYSYQICNNAQCSTATVTINIIESNSFTTSTGTGSLSGSAFYDINENASFETNELGLADWTIYLDLNNNAILDEGETQTKTSQTGSYNFNSLAAGTYTVRAVDQSGWAYTHPANKHYVRTIEASDELGDLNFGLIGDR